MTKLATVVVLAVAHLSPVPTLAGDLTSEEGTHAQERLDRVDYSNQNPIDGHIDAVACAVPTARWQQALAYDQGRGRVVLFGGNAATGDLDDTWNWDGFQWTQLLPQTHPTLRHGAKNMAYDESRGRIVLFGGYHNGAGLNDTWEWDGATWVQRSPQISPSGRYGHAVAYDSARQKLVLFGGWSGSGAVADTWEWDGTSWVQRTPSATPAARFDHAMAYDSARQRVVLFGGRRDLTSSRLAETWEWDGVNWTQLAPGPSPLPRSSHAMSYDSSRHVVVLFGGDQGGVSPDLADTWEWNGTTWTQRTPVTAPMARRDIDMAYDSARSRAVLFGGYNDGSGGLGDTWEWDGTAWTHYGSEVLFSDHFDRLDSPTVGNGWIEFDSLSGSCSDGSCVSIMGGELRVTGGNDDRGVMRDHGDMQMGPEDSLHLSYTFRLAALDRTAYAALYAAFGGSGYHAMTGIGVDNSGVHIRCNGLIATSVAYPLSPNVDYHAWIDYAPNNANVSVKAFISTTGSKPAIPVVQNANCAYSPANHSFIFGYVDFPQGYTWSFDDVSLSRSSVSFFDSDGDGYSECDGDCDDGNAAVYPGASEICDGIDNQCQGGGGYGITDEGCETPHASFSWAPTTPTAGQSVAFSAHSSGDALSYAWDFDGDNTADATGQNVAHTFLTPGPFPVTLTVTNPYGKGVVTNTVSVGTTGSMPIVTSVTRTYPGVFLQGTQTTNLFNATVNWQGSPGTVAFSVNGGPAVIEAGTTTGATHAFETATAFHPSWWPTAVRITPTNLQGLVGPTWTEYVYVYPYPTWLQAALEVGGHLSFTTQPGEVVASVEWQFPDPAFSGVVTIPAWVPYLSGELGIESTSASLQGMASSIGTGSLTVAGNTGFKAADATIGGTVSGTGSFHLGPPQGLELTSATAEFELHGTIEKELGIVDAIPQLRTVIPLPLVGWVNERVHLKSEISPSLDLVATFRQNDDRLLRFDDGTGLLGVELESTLPVNLIPDHLTLKAWLSGGGSFTLGVPAPYLRQATLNAEVGADYELEKFWSVYHGSLSGGYRCDSACTWTPSAGIACPTNCGSTVGLLSAPSLSLIPRNYDRFGAYAHFAPSAIAKKSDARVPESVAQTSVVTNVFPGAVPTVAPAGTGELLLWEHQDPADPIPQSTDISWSYYDGSTWSSPALIANDTRAELAPAAARDSSGHVVAVWSRIKVPAFAIPIDDVSDLPQFYKNLELVSGVFDPTSRTWGPITSLTGDAAFDTDTRISSDSTGNLLLTWLSNRGGEFLSSSASPSKLMYSSWNATTQAWSVPTPIVGGLVGVATHAAAFKGLQAVVLIDRDPNPAVPNDDVIDRYTWNGSTWSGPTVFAGVGSDNRRPSVVYDAVGEGRVVWIRDGDLVAATLSNPTPEVIRAGSDSMALYAARFLTNSAGNLTLVWEEVADNGPANIFAQLLDVASGTWSVDRRLTAELDVEHSNFNGYYGSDGILHGTYLASTIERITKVVNLEGQDYTFTNVPERGQTDLRTLDHSLIVDLAVGDADLSITPEHPVTGDSVHSTLRVHNAGDFTVGTFDVSVYVGEPEASGVLVGTVTVSGPFAAGDERVVEFIYTQPTAVGNLVGVVDSSNQVTELVETNNRARVYLTNRPPVAFVHASLTSGLAPLVAQFDISASYDPDGNPVTYRWSFGDGTAIDEGSPITHTFTSIGRYPVTLTATDNNGGVGTAVVVISAGPLPVPPGPVPDGGSVAGTQMRAGKSGQDVQILWDVTTCPAADYNVYFGNIGNFSAVAAGVCDVGSSGTAVVSVPAGSVWWVVTGTNGFDVGSFGLNSDGREEVLTGWSQFCSVSVQDTSASCP